MKRKLSILLVIITTLGMTVTAQAEDGNEGASVYDSGLPETFSYDVSIGQIGADIDQYIAEHNMGIERNTAEYTNLLYDFCFSDVPDLTATTREFYEAYASVYLSDVNTDPSSYNTVEDKTIGEIRAENQESANKILEAAEQVQPDKVKPRLSSYNLTAARDYAKMYAVYPKKNLPFNSARWKEAEALAGEEGYKHPVRVVFDEKTMTYHTIETRTPIQFLTKDDVEFYKRAEEKDKSIKVFEMDENDFLYLNWRSEPPMTEDEIENIFKQAEQQRRLQEEKNPERRKLKEVQVQNETSESVKKSEWDLSGSVYDCIKRYADCLDQEQIDEILMGMEAGLSEKQIKSYFGLAAEKMSQYRRAYMFGNGR